MRGRKFIGYLLVGGFLGAILVIELSRRQMLNFLPAGLVPDNHLFAIEFAFNLLLVTEVLGLVFKLTHSVADSVGKQFEVLSLILIRETFTEFSHMSEPLVWSEVEPKLLSITATALGSVCIFVVIGIYYHLQRHRPITSLEGDRHSFISGKKLIALGLFMGFIFLMLDEFYRRFVIGLSPGHVFGSFYTLLVFSDVLIVLLSLRFSHNYFVAFRNSGFAMAPVLIRLALIAPAYYGSAIGLGAALFVLGLSAAYNRFALDPA